MVIHGLTGDVFVIMIRKHQPTGVEIKVDMSAVMESSLVAILIIFISRNNYPLTNYRSP